MSERITDARLRELTAAMPDRMGGTLVDTLLLRELAAEILAARTDDARTLAAEAAARGAQYREREALAVVAVLRARLDGERERCARLCDAAAARWRSHRDVDYAARDKLRARGKEAAALAAEIRGVREDARAEWDALHDVLAASVGALDGVGASGDLAALARREAGPVTRRQWRGCSRCGQCFLLADTEAMPGHGVTVDGVDRDCGTKGEGR